MFSYGVIIDLIEDSRCTITTSRTNYSFDVFIRKCFIEVFGAILVRPGEIAVDIEDILAYCDPITKRLKISNSLVNFVRVSRRGWLAKRSRSGRPYEDEVV